MAICLRFTIEGETRESFIGFHATPSTEGRVLFELVKHVLGKLELKLDEIVGECFDGAANMSGVQRGLATRIKDCSPLSIYVRCYGHLLNLAVQDTMTDIEPLRNALGTIQSLYNFLEASPKRHAIFESTMIEKEYTRILKSQSVITLQENNFISYDRYVKSKLKIDYFQVKLISLESSRAGL